jgi:transposase
MDEAKRETRRRHSAQLKSRVLDECAVPGASVAKVALSHGLNANLVHRWRRVAEGREPAVRAAAARTEEFVALPMRAVRSESVPEEIRIEVRRAGLLVTVSWPVSAAASSAMWLRELLR